MYSVGGGAISILSISLSGSVANWMGWSKW